ncbi:chondroitinase family polysaccharide lyase [Vibrio hangzhouensis]|uniref:Chondroitin sulfate ABC lyase n=1 Tax=Vibrio hangzhouensis TaxID=462991 RepID=A0A1H6B8P2_9VIBR|nr:chondroitinase family polysaccharide lyase [Vibrio hangzhouensis]SEG57203.1 chondroitin-sulfate-ABC endolyase/exolyase [Vibrio hangzhouensis]
MCATIGRIVLYVCCSVVFVLSSALRANPLTAQVLVFEDSNIPSWIESDSATITNTRSIIGKQSLQWDWGANSVLGINYSFERISDSQATSAYGRKATQVLSFWIYNEQPMLESIDVVLSNRQGTPSSVTRFPVNLNFSGWRAIGVSLNLDFEPEVTQQFEKIEFVAPQSGQGKLFIDRIMVSVDDERYQWSDYQVQTRYTIPEIDFGLPNDIPNATYEEIEGAKSIKDALVAELRGFTGTMDSLESKFAEFDINVAADGTITGRHILTDKQQVIYQHSHLAPEDRALFDEYAILGDSDGDGSKVAGYAKLMLDLAKAYHEPSFESFKPRLQEMYILMVRHLIDQGFAQGSSMVTTHHWGYSGRWWYNSAILMEQALMEAQLLSPTYEALLWLSREFKESFDMELDIDSSNLDYFNTLSIQHLALILLTPDDNERVALLKKFSKFFSGAVSQTPPGYNDGFRDDGTAWRHNGHYPGYAFAAFDNASIVINMLSHTLYQVNTDALDKMKLVMTAGWRYSNPVVPLGISGRHPFTTLSTKRYEYGLMKLAQSYPELDTELAAMYLAMSNKGVADGVPIFGQKVEPAVTPQGTWSYNGGAFMAHRNGEKLALVKGYNKDVWSSEIYTNDNRYGRYQSHGSVQILGYGSNAEYGHLQDGWDWNRNPGATTINIDFDLLESPRPSTLMVRSDEGLSASTSLNDQFGIFSFKHKAPQHLANFEPSFVANKYVMSVNGELYLAGDGISNVDHAHSTETTLFQIAHSDQSDGIWTNGIYYAGTRFEHQLTSGDWVIDTNGVGYYLIDAPLVVVKRDNQISRHNKNKQETSGDFTSAWIDHGMAPENATYQYIIVMDASTSKMNSLAQRMETAPEYQVLERYEHGQVMVANSHQLYGYSNFEAGEYLRGPVRYISTAAQVMAQRVKNQLMLSISSSELAIQSDNSPTPSVRVEVELEGEWQVEGRDDVEVQAYGDRTKVVVDSLFAQGVEVKLCPLNEGCGESESGSPAKNAGAFGLSILLMLLSLARVRWWSRN